MSKEAPIFAIRWRPTTKTMLNTANCVALRRSAQGLRKLTQLGGRRSEAFLSRAYPRLGSSSETLSCHEFRTKYDELQSNQKSSDLVRICGRVQTIRSAGSRLCFIDVQQMNFGVQVLCDLNSINTTYERSSFKTQMRNLQRGDVIEVIGHPERTPKGRISANGELSIRANTMPCLLAPCLHSLPTKLENAEKKVRNRHVDFQLNKQLRDSIRFRSLATQFIRQYLIDAGHLEVQTPILAGNAGGAIARSFKTSATEFPSRSVSLRIAPELWLKRMVIGGFDRIFEIGPSFRNEGIDSTHNPEFTSCEFYRAYTTIDDLMRITEDMISKLASRAREYKDTHNLDIEIPSISFQPPFPRIDFISGIEDRAKCLLPDLNSSTARESVAQILLERSIQFHGSLTLPQLLDRLCSHYLESQQNEPTWIVNHPECLSPLSKSIRHPTSGQMVALRGELFINTREIVNTYEEENSPFEQKRKFEQQLSFRSDDNETFVDESYIEALEWGMPPTGGWGCGIDRLCMLMTGTPRINDILSFGNLRNVVGLKTIIQDEKKSRVALQNT